MERKRRNKTDDSSFPIRLIIRFILSCQIYITQSLLSSKWRYTQFQNHWISPKYPEIIDLINHLQWFIAYDLIDFSKTSWSGSIQSHQNSRSIFYAGLSIQNVNLNWKRPIWPFDLIEFTSNGQKLPQNETLITR